MEYPLEFPQLRRPRVDVAILEAQKKFPKSTEMPSRIRMAIFSFADIAIAAVEAGEWNLALAHAGVKTFLISLCTDEVSRHGFSSPREFLSVSNKIHDDIVKSAQWMRYMRRFAALAETKSESGPERKVSKIRRLDGSVSSRTAAARLDKYLREKAIGQTDFAIRAQTSDRTIRSFRKTGRVRRSIFAAIAKAMDMTPEELLKE